MGDGLGIVKEGIADRLQRRAAGKRDNLFRCGATCFEHTQLTGRALLAWFQESRIAPQSMSESTFKA